MDRKELALIFVTFTATVGLIAWVASRPTSDGQASSTPSSADKWKVSEDHSPMDDSKTVVLSLDADNTIEGPLGPKQPTLMIRCQEGQTQVYIYTGMAAAVEEDFEGGPLYSHTVRIRLDQASAIPEHWSESNNHEGLFFEGDAITFTKQLAEAQTLTFEFTPFDANPAIARFDLGDLAEHLPELGASCGWSLN